MHLSKIATVLKDDLLDLLFPTCCLGCERRGEWLCERCVRLSILTRPLEHCQLCNKITGTPGLLCRSHQRELGLTGIISFGNYRAFPLRQAIRRLKYEGVWASVSSIVGLGKSRFQPVLAAHDWTAIVPIPLSPARMRERGFNQAELIASALAGISSQASGITTDLIRIKDTAHQTMLGREQRHTNIEDAFAWQGDRLHGSVLLVDDVVTTGATLAEAARVLRAAGARHVWALTLAYEPPER